MSNFDNFGNSGEFYEKKSFQKKAIIYTLILGIFVIYLVFFKR